MSITRDVSSYSVCRVVRYDFLYNLRMHLNDCSYHAHTPIMRIQNHTKDIMTGTNSKLNSRMWHTFVYYVFLESPPTKAPFFITTHLVLRTITPALFSFNWEKGKHPESTACMRKKATSVLSMIIFLTTPHHWRPLAHARNSISKCNKIQSMIHEGQKYITTDFVLQSY